MSLATAESKEIGTLRLEAPGCVQVSGPGVAQALRELTIRANETTTLELVLQPPTFVSIALSLQDGDQSRRRAGLFETHIGLVPGGYRAEAKSDSGACTAFTFVIEPGVVPQPLRSTLR